MAIINAANNGNWSSAATWPGSVFPTSADDVFANNRTIYIDQNINVLSLNTTAGAGGVAGGRFFVNQGNLLINSKTIQAGSTYCVTVTGTGTRTISADNIRASDSTTATAGVLILGTTGLPNVITYGNAVGGTRAGSSNADTPAAITIEGGMLTHYGFISGGNVANRNAGLKIYQSATSTIPVTAIVYGNVKGGPNTLNPGIISEFSPATNTLSACNITIYGNLTGGDSLLTGTTENAGIYLLSNIRTNVFGNIHGGNGYGNTTQAPGIRTGGTGLDLNIVGNIYNSPYGVSAGIYTTHSTGFLNITGDVISVDTLGNSVGSNQTNSVVIFQNGGSTINILGNVYGCRGTVGGGNIGIFTQTSTSTINITGNVVGGNTSYAHGIWINNTPCIINVYGNVQGNNTSVKSFNNHGIVINGTTAANGARVNIFGAAIGSEIDNTSYGVNNACPVATVYAKRVIANSYYVGAGVRSDTPNYGINSTSISGINLVEELVFGAGGLIPVFGPTYIVNTTTNAVTAQKSNLNAGISFLGPDIFVDNTVANTLVPEVSNVRLGTTYGSNLTGTMVVPQASSVSFDIPVGSTRGTAYLAPSAFWNTQTTELTSLSTTIGYRLNNTATTEFIGNTLAAYNI